MPYLTKISSPAATTPVASEILTKAVPQLEPSPPADADASTKCVRTAESAILLIKTVRISKNRLETRCEIRSVIL